MTAPITLAVEVRGADEAAAAIRQIDPMLPAEEIAEAVNVALAQIEYRTQAALDEPSEWQPLRGIRCEVTHDS